MPTPAEKSLYLSANGGTPIIPIPVFEKELSRKTLDRHIPLPLSFTMAGEKYGCQTIETEQLFLSSPLLSYLYSEA